MADDPKPAAPATYNFKLIAQDTFKGYKRGDIIEDPKEIAEIMDSHHESFVTKVAK